jgi:hypothetical protein
LIFGKKAPLHCPHCGHTPHNQKFWCKDCGGQFYYENGFPTKCGATCRKDWERLWCNKCGFEDRVDVWIRGQKQLTEEDFKKRLKGWLKHVKSTYASAERQRHVSRDSGIFMVLNGIVIYEMLKYFSSKYPDLENDVASNEDFYERLIEKVELSFPGDYYEACRKWHKRGASSMSQGVLRLICLIAFTVLAKKLQGADTGLDLGMTFEELKPLIHMKKYFGEFVGPDIDPINAMMAAFWDRGRMGLGIPPASGKPLIISGLPLTPEELYNRGKEFESTDGDAIAEEFYDEAIDKELDKLVSERPMGKDMSKLKEYMKKRDEVEESRQGHN